MRFIIFKTTHLATGRYYIGKTTRYKWEAGYVGSGTILKAIVRKYGRASLSREILAETDNETEAYRIEKEQIGLCFGLDPLCINLKSGGKGGAFGGTRSAETRAKISKAGKGIKRNVTDEHRRNLSKALKGRLVSKETREKISKTLTGRPALQNRKPFTLRGQRFSCEKEAMQHFGVTQRTIYCWKKKEKEQGK